jgi:hypothetical protein
VTGDRKKVTGDRKKARGKRQEAKDNSSFLLPHDSEKTV